MKPSLAGFALACALVFANAASAAPDPDKAVLVMHLEAANAVLHAEHAAQGDAGAPEQLQAVVANMRRALDAVPATDTRHAGLAAQVDKVQAAAKSLATSYPDFAAARGAFSNLVFRAPQLSAQWAEVIRGLSAGGAAPAQLNLAHRQRYLLDLVVQRAGESLESGNRATAAAERLARDAEVYQAVLDDFTQGNAHAGVARVEQADARLALEKIRQWQDAQRQDTEAVLSRREAIAAVHAAAREVNEARAVLLDVSPPAF